MVRAPPGSGGYDPIQVKVRKLPSRWCFMRHTLIHCFSSFERMSGLIILVWMGTHVRRSKPSHMCPLYSCLVCGNVIKCCILPRRIDAPEHASRRARTQCAYPMSRPCLYEGMLVSITFAGINGNSSQKPGSFVITCPGTRGASLENPCGPSCTLRKEPNPCPVPC